MKKTIGDKLIDFYNGYVAPTKVELKVGKKELEVTEPTEYDPGRVKKSGWLTKELSPEQLRKTSQQCPLLMKGIRKKCLDGTRAWLNLEILPDRGKPIKEDLQIIYDFEKRNNFKSLWSKLKINSYIYGDGFALITYQNDEKTKLWQKPSEGAIPWRVKLMDAEHINEFDYYPPKKKQFEKIKTMHFHYEDTNQHKDYWIHPDRIIHMPRDPLPNKIFGNSVINLLRNTIKSKVNIDIASGEILSWYAHGVFDIAVEGLEEEEKIYWEKVADTHPGAWIHKKDQVEIKAIKPEAIDPTAFYEYITINIAAAIIMPTHLLTGIQVGRVTGAEIGFADYYRDVKDIQELDDSPLIEKLYENILKSKGKVWKYSIKWNQIYVDELAEAEIMDKRTTAADKAFNGGFIDQEEARDIYNKGQIKLDASKKIKAKKPPLVPKPTIPGAPKPPGGKNIEELPTELTGDDADEADAKRLGISLVDYKLGKNIYKFQLGEVDKAMIQKRKDNAKRERKLGDEILKQQDEEKNV